MIGRRRTRLCRYGEEDCSQLVGPVLFNTTEAAKPNAVEGLTSEAATDTSGASRACQPAVEQAQRRDRQSTNYDIEVQDEEGDWVVQHPRNGENSSPSTRTSYTDPDEPEADEVRKYRVRASNNAGEGPWTMVYYPREPAADHTSRDDGAEHGDGIL